MSDGGKRYWFVGGIFLVVILLAGAYYFYWQWKAYQTERLVQNASNGVVDKWRLPKEMAEEFDPVATFATYKVIGVGEESGRVQLEYVFPKTKYGQKVESSITCPMWDSKVFESGSKVPRYVSHNEMIEIIARNQDGQLFLSGKCSDQSCTTIDSACSLSISLVKEGI